MELTMSQFTSSEEGTTSTEYGVFISGLGMVITVFAWWWGSFFSWSFTTLSDCIDVNFDPACYSASSNQDVPVETGDPAWWPHEDGS